MALSKSALKAKFVTGAIPTQTDFANLIDGMLSMPLEGGTGDTTIGFGNGDSTDRLYVKSLRYIYNDNCSYFLIGAWDDEIGGNYLVAVICFQDNAVSGANFNITYHLLDKTDRAHFESEVGDINTADEIDLINNIKGSGWAWFNITQPTNNNPSPRTIQSNNITYRIYPVLQMVYGMLVMLSQWMLIWVVPMIYMFIVVLVILKLNGLLLTVLSQMI